MGLRFASVHHAILSRQNDDILIDGFLQSQLYLIKYVIPLLLCGAEAKKVNCAGSSGGPPEYTFLCASHD